jgi:hypothetical protein
MVANMGNWSKKRVPELRDELKRKELPHDWRKHILVKRLEFENDETMHTAEGRKASYEQERQKRMDSITPFTYFPKFPPEIRNAIWFVHFLLCILPLRLLRRHISRLLFLAFGNITILISRTGSFLCLGQGS